MTTVELEEGEVLCLLDLLLPRMLEIRRKDPDGPTALYPDILLYQKLQVAAQADQIKRIASDQIGLTSPPRSS